MSDREPTLKPVSLDDIPDGYDVAYEPGEEQKQPDEDRLEPYGWTCTLSSAIHRDGREMVDCKGTHSFLWREVD